MTKVSIVIPVYNTSAYLEKCLNSVINQDYPNLEIIAVNDGSTDCSLEILEQFAQKYSTLRVINQPNEGHQSARNNAIANATGDFLGFLDSDDSLPARDIISKLSDAITPQTQIIVGRINIDNGERQKLFPSAVFSTISTQEYMKRYLLCGKVSWNLCGKLFKAELLKSQTNIPIKVTAGEDALGVISLANQAQGCVTMINIPVYNYFIRPGSITQSKNPEYIYDNFKVADYIDNLLKDKVEEKYRVAFRLLCFLTSFRYGYFGSKHPLNAQAIKCYKQTRGVLPLFAYKKRLKIWVMVNFSDFLSKFVFKNRINEA